MKKWKTMLLVCTVGLSLIGCGKDTTQTFTSDGSPEGDIEAVIRNRVSSEYRKTDIESITINADLGTEEPDDHVALVYLTWNVMNTGSMSKEMLSMYSEDLAATLGNECPSVQEVAIFWTVPYLNDATAKCSYERSSSGMVEMDMSWTPAFQ